MGDEAQSKFANGWGVGLAIGQATQFKDMVIVALQSAAVLTVLETLWIVGNKPWLEEHIGAQHAPHAPAAAPHATADDVAASPRRTDFASVQASMLQEASSSWFHRMQAHLAYYSAVA
jgi:hypothetical protein